MILDIRMMMGDQPTSRPERADSAEDCGFTDLLAADMAQEQPGDGPVIPPDAMPLAIAPFPVAAVLPAAPDPAKGCAAESLAEGSADVVIPAAMEMRVDPDGELQTPSPPPITPTSPPDAVEIAETAPKADEIARPAPVAADAPSDDGSQKGARDSALPGPSGLSIVLRAIAYPQDEPPDSEPITAAPDEQTVLPAPVPVSGAEVVEDFTDDPADNDVELPVRTPFVEPAQAPLPDPFAGAMPPPVHDGPVRDGPVPVAAAASSPPPPAPPPPVAAPQRQLEVIETAPPEPGGIALDLSSEDLGTLRMEITRSGERLNVAVTADRTDTIDLARRHAAEFVADLRQSGYGQADLSFGQWGGQRPSLPRDAGGPLAGLPGEDPPPSASRDDRRLPGAAHLDIRI